MAHIFRIIRIYVRFFIRSSKFSSSYSLYNEGIRNFSWKSQQSHDSSCYPGHLFLHTGAIFVDKYGSKKTGSAGLFLITLGSLIGFFSGTFFVLDIGRFLVGIGGAIVVVAAPSILPKYFSTDELGSVMGLFAINMPAATIIAFNSLEIISKTYGWRSTQLISFLLSFITLIFYFLVIKDPKQNEPYENGEISFSGLKSTQIWILGLIWAFFNMAAISYTTFSGSFFSEFKGVPKSYADFLASMLMIPTIFICPFVGYVSDRIQKRKIIITSGLFGISLAFFCIPFSFGIFVLLSTLFLGIMASFIPPPIFALSPEVLRENVGMGFGVLNTCLNLGIASGPMLTGIIRDLSQSEFISYMTMASFSIIAMVLSLRLKTR